MKTGLISNETVRTRVSNSATLWRLEKPAIRGNAEIQAIRVSIQGCGYLVDLGADGDPRFHRVSKNKECSCGDPTCEAIEAVREYLRSGGIRAPNPLGNPVCPICGAATFRDRNWDGKYTRELGWRCEKGGLRHFLMAKTDRIKEQLRNNPWLFPPIPGYAGVQRSEVMTADECALVSARIFLETGYDPTR
jgi:hypothetical protein